MGGPTARPGPGPPLRSLPSPLPASCRFLSMPAPRRRQQAAAVVVAPPTPGTTPPGTTPVLDLMDDLLLRGRMRYARGCTAAEGVITPRRTHISHTPGGCRWWCCVIHTPPAASPHAVHMKGKSGYRVCCHLYCLSCVQDCTWRECGPPVPRRPGTAAVDVSRASWVGTCCGGSAGHRAAGHTWPLSQGHLPGVLLASTAPHRVPPPPLLHLDRDSGPAVPPRADDTAGVCEDGVHVAHRVLRQERYGTRLPQSVTWALGHMGGLQV